MADKMKPSDIQRIVMAALNEAGAHILKSTTYSLSCEPGEVEAQVPEYGNCFIVGAIMTREQYYNFRATCNQKGVWINAQFWPFNKSGELFEYSIQGVEKR